MSDALTDTIGVFPPPPEGAGEYHCMGCCGADGDNPATVIKYIVLYRMRSVGLPSNAPPVTRHEYDCLRRGIKRMREAQHTWDTQAEFLHGIAEHVNMCRMDAAWGGFAWGIIRCLEGLDR